MAESNVRATRPHGESSDHRTVDSVRGIALRVRSAIAKPTLSLDGIGLSFESNDELPDYEAARTVIDNGIEPIVGIEIDTTPFIDRSIEMSHVAESVIERMNGRSDASTQAQPTPAFTSPPSPLRVLAALYRTVLVLGRRARTAGDSLGFVLTDRGSRVAGTGPSRPSEIDRRSEVARRGHGRGPHIRFDLHRHSGEYSSRRRGRRIVRPASGPR